LEPADSFGTVLRKLREEAKMSQERLASESDLDRTYISLLERGLRQPSLTSIIRLSKALKISSVKMISTVEKMIDTKKAG
jgi:transcriptional regulator with XRE-family HTH domain